MLVIKTFCVCQKQEADLFDIWHLWDSTGALNKDNDRTEGNGSFLLMFLTTEHWDFPSLVSPCGWYSEELPEAEALAEEVLE